MKFIFKCAFFVLYSFAALSAVDYSACQAFLQPNTNPGIGFGGFKPIMPFSLKDDGSIQKADFADLKTEDGGRTQVFSYSLPGGFPIQEGAEIKTNTIPMQVTLKRDEKGNITEIIQGDNQTTEMLKTMDKWSKENYERSVPESIRKQNDEFLGGEDKKYYPPFFSYRGQSIDFDIKNGKCIPSKINQSFYTEPKKNGDSVSITLMDTQLCRDVNEFIKANPEASACFRKDINDRMGMIFKKHAPNYQQEASNIMSTGNPFGGFGGGYGGFGMLGGGGFGGMGGFAYNSLATNVLSGDEQFLKNTSDVDYLEIKRRFGNTPVMNGQRILQSCFDNGIRNIIEDESIWKRAENNASGQAPSNEAKIR